MKTEIKYTVSTFSISTLQAWLQNPDIYKKWLDEHKAIPDRITAFALTLETLLDHWSEWQDHYQAERLFPLIINGTNWTHENFAQLNYGQISPGEIADCVNSIISDLLDILRQFPNVSASAINLITPLAWDVFIQHTFRLLTPHRTDSSHCGFLGLHNLLLLTGKLYQTGLLSSESFFNIFAPLSSLTEAGLIYLESARAINLLWLEEEIKKQPHLTAQMATHFLRLFSSLTRKNYLKQAVNNTTVDFLLHRLVTAKEISLEVLWIGLESFENLLTWRFNLEGDKLLKKLDKPFHLLISPHIGEQKGNNQRSLNSNSQDLIRTTKLIRKIFQTIHDRSNDPHPMDCLTLQNLFQAFLNHANRLSQAQMNELIVSTGEILQMGRSPEQDKLELQKAVEALACLFSSRAGQMSLQEVSRALYGLSLLSFSNIQTTEPLVSRFEFLLTNSAKKITPTTIAQAHQGAQYLVRSGVIKMTLPDYLESYITASTPSPRRKSRLNSLRQHLVKQVWFNSYNFTAEKTFGISHTDGCITDQKTGLNYVFELDDIDHLEGVTEEKQNRLRWQDELRDQWLLGLKDKQGEPVIKGVLRLPLWPPHRSDIPTLADKIQSFILNVPESKKTISPVSSPIKRAEAKVEVSGLAEISLDDSKTVITESSVSQKKVYAVKAKKKRSKKKQDIPLVGQNMLFKAIKNKVSLEEMQELLKGKLENLSDSQKAHILIRILETYPQDQMDILKIFCMRFSADVIACTNEKGMSPVVRAVELQCLPAVEIFAAKTPKTIKLPPPQWQKAVNLASRNQYQAIENALVKKGVKVSSVASPESVPLRDKKESRPDNRFFVEFKNKFVDSNKLLSPSRDFVNSVVNDIDKFSEQRLQTIALQGNADAQLLLASSLNENKDTEGYLYWLEKSANGGNVSAQSELGNYYAVMETDENRQKAFEWFRRAAEQGFASAQYNLGLCYKLGIGVAVNHGEALSWYRKAVEQNHAYAQNNLASYYLEGIHVKEDLQVFKTLISKSAKQGDMIGQYNLGKCYCIGMGFTVNPKKAIKWYKKSAKQNYPEAQAVLAQFYLNGEFLKKDVQKSLILCRKALESGLAEAKFILGNYYCYHENDYREARKWYQKAADQNVAEGQFAIGFMNSEGFDGKKDEKEAAKWYRKAAEQGLAEAEYRLGDYYHVIEKNYKEAEKWFQKAALQGIAGSQYNMGRYYEINKWRQRDFSIAIYWFTLAAKQNFNDAEEHLLMAQVLISIDFLKSGQESASVYWLKQAKSQGSKLADDLLTMLKSGIYARNKELVCTTFSSMLNASQEKLEEWQSFHG